MSATKPRDTNRTLAVATWQGTLATGNLAVLTQVNRLHNVNRLHFDACVATLAADFYISQSLVIRIIRQTDKPADTKPPANQLSLGFIAKCNFKQNPNRICYALIMFYLVLLQGEDRSVLDELLMGIECSTVLVIFNA